MDMQIRDVGTVCRLAIVGAGEMGLQALHYARLDISEERRYEVVGFIDDTKDLNQKISGIDIIGKISDTETLFADNRFDAMFIAIGYRHLEFKAQLIDRFKPIIPLANIISPHTYIDRSAKIASNVMIYPGCVIDKNVVIEDGVTLNLGCIISHDSYVGKATFVAPGVNVAGFSKIGRQSFIGCGSTIIDNISLGDNIRLGASTVVTTSLDSAGLYVGVPARKVR